MYPCRTPASNTVALIAGMLLICFCTQIRAEGPEVAGSAEPHAEAGAILFGSQGNLWIINSDGSGLKQVSNFKADDVSFSASWSPDGSKITYLNYRLLRAAR